MSQAPQPFRTSFRDQIEPLLTSAKQYAKSIPLFTSFVLGTCLVFYAVGWFVHDLSASLGLWMEAIIYRHQVYRIITYPFIHLSFPHILFNLIAFVPLSFSQERAQGTLKCLTTFMFPYTLVSAIFYCLILIALNVTGLFGSGAIIGGLSGNVFALIVWQVRQISGQEISFFGLVQIPAHIYPIFLLLIIQLLFPGAAFLGHLCGIATGYLFAYGYFDRILPSDTFYERLESYRPLSWIVDWSGFVSIHEAREGRGWLPISQSDVDPTLTSSFYTSPPSNTTQSTSPPSSFPGQGHRLGSA
ncbi:uncharacterized protein VTP21DRAFT_10375 [Calcarisporiella thermophila]|uniref:uncharacterized protein n=1 Tax=Calcarisporiella thermophila TaxID=911321 RepID=UPI003742B430